MTLTANQIYLLGKTYMSIGDGQWDQAVHIILETDKEPEKSVFDPLLEEITDIIGVGPEIEVEGYSDDQVCMGAVENFLKQHGVEAEFHWLEVYEKYQATLKK